MTRNPIPINTRFGLLVVVQSLGKGKDKYYVECLCDCGKTTRTTENQLRSGKTKSCGHLKVNYQSLHGMHKSPEYTAFHAARQRCRNPKSPEYKNYGARGIEFRFESFEAFYAEVGPRPSGNHSIDRIDNDGHYERGNLRWATPSQQSANRRVCKK